MIAVDPEKFDNRREYARKAFEGHDDIFDRDVVILHTVMSASVLDEYDVPSVLIMHGGMRQLGSFFEETMDASPEVMEYFSRQNIGEARDKVSELLDKPDVLVSNSEFIRDEVEDNYGHSSKVLYPPIDVDKFNYTGEGREDFFLSVQRMVWYKKLDAQIEAFKDLDKKLVIVGEGNFDNVVRKEAEKHDNIEFKGRVSDEDLVSLYTRAQATIQTAKKEDFGYVPRESLACGTPVILPDEGGFSELFEKGDVGYSFDPDRRAENLREAVKKFEDGYDRDELRQIVLDNHSFEAVKPRLESFVKEAYDKHGE